MHTSQANANVSFWAQCADMHTFELSCIQGKRIRACKNEHYVQYLRVRGSDCPSVLRSWVWVRLAVHPQSPSAKHRFYHHSPGRIAGRHAVRMFVMHCVALCCNARARMPACVCMCVYMWCYVCVCVRMCMLHACLLTCLSCLPTVFLFRACHVFLPSSYLELVMSSYLLWAR